ncbi:hypothetical protein U9M48_036754 [Paspalum notatum var. saurae]|uniref:NB-ARC domain-containing protein n=1 Tax=Paspalum notatum var. saurae TaxID=547442 RepID=A0AAQ3UDP8_PASNO
MIGACLHQLQNLNLVHGPESRKLITSLEETLGQILTLFTACQNSRITYHFSGRRLDCELKEVHGKIGIYLVAFPNIIDVYMVCHFTGAVVPAHLAEVQVQKPHLFSGSFQRIEESPPPPSISGFVFNCILNKAFIYLECYGMGVGVDVLHLKDKLLSRMGEIQAVLDSDGSLEIKKRTAYSTWIWPLRDAIEETEDAVDSIAYYLCERAARTRRVQHKVQRPKPKVLKGKDIKSANSVFRICITRLRNAVLNLDDVAADAYLHRYHGTRDTSDYNHGSVDNLFIGRVIEKEEIVCWLTQSESEGTDQGLSVFAVHGKGGMGKTALAQLVYRDEEVIECFDSMIWLHFHNNFDIEIMTLRVLESVANWRFSYDTLEDLQKILVSELSSKKFLLVLDGAQDGDRIDEWEKFMAPLRYGQKGNRILLTTQELSVVNTVAELTGTKPKKILLNGLSYDDSLMLFKKYAFAGLDPETYVAISPGISEESIALVVKETVERFEGCPLLIKALGGYLGDNMHSHHLNEMVRLLKYTDYRGDTDRLLKLCYHGLPTHVQACFRYFSIFPREHKFSKTELVKLWMGSGLISDISDCKQSPEEIGQMYLNTLVRRSFVDKIVETKFCAEHEEYYVVPSSMYELAQYFSLGECARVNTDELEHINQSVRHLYIVQHNVFSPEKLKVISRLKYLRTLIIEGDLRGQDAEGILGKILEGLSCLRVLSLPKTSLNFLGEMTNLLHLRYISVFKCGKSDLLKVFKHYHLRLVKICHLQAKAIDFEDIINLQHLRYLDIPGNYYPKGTQIGNLSELQELDNYVISKAEGFGVSTLKNLLGVRRMGLLEMENIIDCLDVARFKLNHKSHLKSLSLTWSTGLTGDIDDQILDDLEPPRGLEELHITGYSGRIPRWMVNESLLKLVYLEIKDCTSWDSIPSLSALQFLRYLRLEHLSNLRCIGDNFELHTESDAFVGTCFPPFLEILRVELCPKLKRLPNLPLSLNQLVLEFVGLEIFPKIKLISDNQPNESSSSLMQSKLVSLHVENCSDLPCLNEGLLQQQEHLGSLQKVVIKRCEILEHLPPEGFSGLVQLKYLEVISCPVLRMRKDTCLFPVSLRYFAISRCDDAEIPIVTSFERSVSLRRLSLSDCNNLQNLPSERVFENLGMLHEITIARCRNLLSLGGLVAAGSLRLLTVVCCDKLLESSVVDNIKGCSLKLDKLKIDRQNLLLVEPLINLTSTQELHICNDDGMTYLPESWLLKNSASLHSIVIGVADSLVSVPSWLIKLEHLQILHIERASLIESIPEMPTSLRKLTIWGCHPLLLERCQKDVGLDWPKIANIYADLQAFSRGARNNVNNSIFWMNWMYMEQRISDENRQELYELLV